jgi:hypothetical protein
VDTDLDYHAVKAALRTGDGLQGTIEFFPEAGTADGHRACSVSWAPGAPGRRRRLPQCGRPLTIRCAAVWRTWPTARPGDPESAAGVYAMHLVQLPEVLGEIHGVGARSKTVEGELVSLVAALGCELDILARTPLDEIRTAGGEMLAEAIRRLRSGQVHRTPGYDGVYGSSAVRPRRLRADQALFSTRADTSQDSGAGSRTSTPPPAGIERRRSTAGRRVIRAMLAGLGVGGLLDRLDPAAGRRRRARRPLLIVAGPGTGKTHTSPTASRTCAPDEVPPQRCLAITFTRRRPRAAYPARRTAQAGRRDVTVATFHALGLAILREGRRKQRPGSGRQGRARGLLAEAGDDRCGT